jgi:DNA-binding NarL/FixJ family response regulator
MHLPDGPNALRAVLARLEAGQVDDAKALLARVIARIPDGHVRSSHEALTAQERRIAELVRSGRTNKEIAADLYLSPRTVEFHLRGVFRKLEVRTRTELAAALPPHDLSDEAAA